jgi:L-threonylcarbamoyladenylate synthase
MDFSKSLRSALNKAVRIVNEGGVVVFPTDTVYGFLADAGSLKALEKIFKIKKRSRAKPLAVFVKDLKMAKELAEISPAQERVLKKHWPGSYTFVLKSKYKNQTAKFLTKNRTIALRVPKYKLLNDLLEEVNRPLAQTSVNVSGQPEINKISEIIEAFSRAGSGPDFIVDAGNLPKRRPSVIMDLTNNDIKILRK